MNRNLVEFFAAFAYFLKGADDAFSDPKTVGSFWEAIGYRLDRFTPAERAEFAQVLDEIARDCEDPDEAAFYGAFAR